MFLYGGFFYLVIVNPAHMDKQIGSFQIDLLSVVGNLSQGVENQACEGVVHLAV